MINLNDNCVDIVLNMALEFNELSEYIKWKYPYNKVITDRYGNPMFSAPDFMEALYRKYGEIEGIKEKEEFVQEIDKTLKNMLENKQSIEDAKKCLGYMDHHLRREAKGDKPPFKLDMKGMLRMVPEECKNSAWFDTIKKHFEEIESKGDERSWKQVRNFYQRILRRIKRR